MIEAVDEVSSKVLKESLIFKILRNPGC